MKLSELPNRDLVRAIEATESSSSPDRYALETLRAELDRRLSAAEKAKEQMSDNMKLRRGHETSDGIHIYRMDGEPEGTEGKLVAIVLPHLDNVEIRAVARHIEDASIAFRSDTPRERK